MQGRTGQAAQPVGGIADRQHGQRPRQRAGQETSAITVQQAFERAGEAAKAHQRMPAARLAQQQIEQYAGRHQACQHGQRQAAQHGAPFRCRGRPAATNTALSQMAATAWFRRPASSVKQREMAPYGTIPMPTSFDTRIRSQPVSSISASAYSRWARSLWNSSGRAMSPTSGYVSPLENIRFVSHKVRQSTSS